MCLSFAIFEEKTVTSNFWNFKNSKMKRLVSKIFVFSNIILINVDSNCMCSLSVKVLSNYLHLQAHCDKLKAFRIAQFFQNSKIQKITVKKFFFRNSDDGFLLIGVFWVYIRSFKAKLAETKIWIFSESNPIFSYLDFQKIVWHAWLK